MAYTLFYVVQYNELFFMYCLLIVVKSKLFLILTVFHNSHVQAQYSSKCKIELHTSFCVGKAYQSYAI
ncbi:hypothetical protein K450DRAFT_243227 [Umbelopsis ramanniana AG]|uniref:Uncharacterized protein n=1 Tax=Umbelopsis ramanniana AG TaxID=1314678 RepID=A0AAD5HEP4_UMBRA|nr:uncharacterized protein K450DRAFT_243227 [Umbelopsis ramanniana AG]KAI8579198.1 hypothetical protein K450DRAFT_243227 [Umbelopsis ramanniana AG]